MRALLVFLASVAVAHAERATALSNVPTGVGEKHLLLRLPIAMVFDDKADRGVLDDAVKLTMTARAVVLDDDVALCVAAARDLATRGVPRAKLEKLPLGPRLHGCSVTPPRPRFGDELLYAAYIQSTDGAVLLAFYADGSPDLTPWLALADRIVASAASTTADVGPDRITGADVKRIVQGWLITPRAGGVAARTTTSAPKPIRPSATTTSPRR